MKGASRLLVQLNQVLLLRVSKIAESLGQMKVVLKFR